MFSADSPKQATVDTGRRAAGPPERAATAAAPKAFQSNHVALLSRAQPPGAPHGPSQTARLSAAVLQRTPDDPPATAGADAPKPSDRESILGALRSGDRAAFQSQLVAVPENMRFLLEADDAFVDELRHTLTAMDLWLALASLHYGADVPSCVGELQAAVNAPNFNKMKDLVRAIPQLRNEVPGTREMLDRTLAARPAGHDEVLAVFDDQVTATGERNETMKSVRYGVAGRPGEDTGKLIDHSETAQYTVDRTASELRVIVRIHLFDENTGDTFHLKEDIERWWLSGIENRWSGKFVADNGATSLKILFVPAFTDTDSHVNVKIVHARPAGPAANARAWWEGAEANVIAHEFGHLLGLPDEYGLPGSAAEIPPAKGLSPAETKATTVEGIEGKAKPAVAGGYTEPGMMGGMKDAPTTVKARHVIPAVDWYNANLKPKSEADYAVKPAG